MANRSRLGALILSAALVAGCASTTPSPFAGSHRRLRRARPRPGASADWHDSTLTIETRVDALVAQMTVDEKIGQMTQIQNGRRRRPMWPR